MILLVPSLEQHVNVIFIPRSKTRNLMSLNYLSTFDRNILHELQLSYIIKKTQRFCLIFYVRHIFLFNRP